MPKYENGKIILELPQECELCGIIFTTTSTEYHENKQNPEWSNHFGCCTQDCLERFYDYDGFKDQFKYRVHTGITTRDMRPLEWSIWIKAKIFKVCPDHMTLYDQFKMEYEYIVCKMKMERFASMGLDFDRAEWLSYGEISDNVWVSDKEWGFCKPDDYPDNIVGW